MIFNLLNISKSNIKYYDKFSIITDIFLDRIFESSHRVSIEYIDNSNWILRNKDNQSNYVKLEFRYEPLTLKVKLVYSIDDKLGILEKQIALEKDRVQELHINEANYIAAKFYYHLTSEIGFKLDEEYCSKVREVNYEEIYYELINNYNNGSYINLYFLFSINRDYNALELKESFEHEIGKANYLRGVGFISEEVAKSRFYTLYCYYKFMQNEDFMSRYREFLDKQKDYKKKKYENNNEEWLERTPYTNSKFNSLIYRSDSPKDKEIPDVVKLYITAKEELVFHGAISNKNKHKAFEKLILYSIIVLSNYGKKYPNLSQNTLESYFEILFLDQEHFDIRYSKSEFHDFFNLRITQYTLELNNMLMDNYYIPLRLYYGLFEKPLSINLLPSCSNETQALCFFKELHNSIKRIKEVVERI